MSTYFFANKASDFCILCHSAQKRNSYFGRFDEHKTYHLVIFHIKTAKKLLLLNGEIFLNMHNLFCKFSNFA